MHRDDGLVLLMLAAEGLGYNVYNARDYVFCTENQVDYDSLFLSSRGTTRIAMPTVKSPCIFRTAGKIPLAMRRLPLFSGYSTG